MFDKKFLDLALEEAEKSRCVRQHVGCVIEKDGEVLMREHNGPSEKLGCLNGCLRENEKIESGTRQGYCYTNCAETSAICFCARDGISTNGANAYVSHQPCIICTKVMADAGIVNVYYKNAYPDELSPKIAAAAGLNFVHIKD
ncbi:MAG: cytidine deaminase [Christensenellaceae bacterium]|jgi:dCMP deaminase|nr:cytidine deaminase [Christensenellaceae bacterium]